MTNVAAQYTASCSYDVAFCTVVAKNYLSYARVLNNSLRLHHPNIPFFLLLSDEIGGYFSSAHESFQMLSLQEIIGTDLPRLPANFSRKQLAIVTKPYLLIDLLNRGFRSVLFLDPDMLVLDEFDALMVRTRQHSITLTPHLISPLRGPSRVERELNILQSGAYNAGFIGVTNTPTARHFLVWWQDRVRDNCRHAIAEGLYYDQRWLDLVPSYFSDVHILRDPAVNIGHWNLGERDVWFDGEVTMTGDQPVKMFHFSGFDPDRLPAVTRYSNELTLDKVGAAAALFKQYAVLLDTAGYQVSKSWPFAYHQVDSSVISES